MKLLKHLVEEDRLNNRRIFVYYEQIKRWLEDHDVRDASIMGSEYDHVVSVQGNVILDHTLLGDRYIPVNFSHVTGAFSIVQNGLISLEGSPETVYGDYDCSGNHLESFYGCPRFTVEFACRSTSGASLKTLEYLPEECQEIVLPPTNSYVTGISLAPLFKVKDLRHVRITRESSLGEGLKLEGAIMAALKHGGKKGRLLLGQALVDLDLDERFEA